MGTTTITINKEVKEMLSEHKPEGTTWNAFLLDIVEQLEDDSDSEEGSESESGEPDAEGVEKILTEIMHLRNELDNIPKETASELEGRLRQY